MASRLRLAHLLLIWVRSPTRLSNHPIVRPIPYPWQCGMRYEVAHGYTHRAVSLVIRDGHPKFEMHEFQEPKKSKWMSKKRLKKKRMREKMKRKEANKRDPRRLRSNKGNPRFATAEERLKYKIHKAKIKEALLVERLKAYEVLKVQGPMVKPETLTGEERFYMKKMAQKRSNYVPVGRRGIFGGVILNMHLHWKKHETVKVICKPCKPGQVHEYAREIARLSGGIPIQVIGDDTIIFYRGRNYVRPEVMSPIDTLSKKKALEKSKYEQSLETVRHFIAIAEKELQLYYQHIALYGNPSTRSTDNSAPFMHTTDNKAEGLREGEGGAYGVTTAGTHLNIIVGLIDGNAGDVEHNDDRNDGVQSNHEAPSEISVYTDVEENDENIYLDIEASEDNNYSSTEECEENTLFDTDSGTEECEDDNIQ